MADVFEDRRDLDPQRARLWHLIIDTPHLDWLLLTKRPENFRRLLPPDWLDVPRGNVWLGTSVGDRKSLARMEHLRDIPAAIRFVSGEPMLEDLGQVNLRGIGWWVCGGESGAGARPMRLEWARSIVEQCKAAGVRCFFKQAGARPVEDVIVGPSLLRQPRPVRLKDRKGGDLSEIPGEWPREFPEAAR